MSVPACHLSLVILLVCGICVICGYSLHLARLSRFWLSGQREPLTLSFAADGPASHQNDQGENKFNVSIQT